MLLLTMIIIFRSLVRIHMIRQRQLIHTKQFIPREPSPLLPLCIYQLTTMTDEENVSVYFNSKTSH